MVCGGSQLVGGGGRGAVGVVAGGRLVCARVAVRVVVVAGFAVLAAAEEVGAVHDLERLTAIPVHCGHAARGDLVEERIAADDGLW
jgi:hypothetical protein